MAVPSPTIQRVPSAREAWSRLEAEREVDAWLSGEEYEWATPEERGAVWSGYRWVSHWEAQTYNARPVPRRPTGPRPSSPTRC